MAKKKWELTAETLDKMLSLPSDLRAEVEGMREKYNGMSERWQESDKGQAIDAWLDGLWDLADTIENTDEEIDPDV